MIGFTIMPKLFLDDEEVFSPEETADKLGMGIATLYRRMKDGKIAYTKHCGHTYFTKSEIKRYQEEQESLKKHQTPVKAGV
jgi:predicted site-specific integrase-resolvase